MARILILEDDLERRSVFAGYLSEHDTVPVTLASTAIELLEKEEWDWLFLDHDLGDTWRADEGHNTGYAVAKWLEEHPERKPRHIILHSMNPIGRERMQQALPEAIQLPGAWNCTLDEIREAIGAKTNGHIR
jgi:CheY-like chemotaxis protein